MKKMTRLVVVLALGLDWICLAVEGTWTYKADMPTARVFASGCVIDGRIYVIGGAPSASSVTSAVEMYDPTTDTWTKMANMPSGRCGHASCTLDGRIYVFGGNSPDMWSTAKKNVYVYDPRVDTWTERADMPYAIAGCGIAVVDGTVYLIGGDIIESSPPVPTVMAYNPITESWTQKADMPTARYLLSASVLGGKIYAVGGCTEDWRQSSYKHLEVYDPSTDTWTRKSDMPTQRWGLGTSVVDGKIFAIGGNSAFYATTTATEVYDPVADTWSTRSSMQQKRYGLCVASIGDKVFAIGGSVPGILSIVEEYDTGLPPPDFNGDGFVDIKDLLRLIESWGQDDPLVDIAPPYGDGIIDILDLEALMAFWGQEVNDPTLAAHWKLDEAEGIVAYDSAGENDGTILGVPLWRPYAGNVGGALEFDGTYFVVADAALSPADGPFSVLAWVEGGAPGQAIVAQQAGANWLMLDPITGGLMTDLKSARRSATALYSDVVITDGDWHRMAFTWDTMNRRLYVDGVLVAEDTQGTLAGSFANLVIGAGKTMAPDTFFRGLIDDVRIYDRAVQP